MRVIHFADLHIGVEQYGRPLPEHGWSSRMQDFLDAFDHLVAYAIDSGTDAVIFAGDAYKAREPSQTHQREFARRIRRLSEAGIAVFLLVGNHDLQNREGRAHALEIFRTLHVPNVYVGDERWFEEHGFVPQVMETRSGPLQVGFLPWPRVSRLVASDPAAPGMTIEQIHREVERRLSLLVAAEAEALDPALPAVLACHVSINDAIVREKAGSEQWMTVGTAPTLLKSDLCEQAWDYIALGHHHNAMPIALQTPCWYSGSMQAVDFGEEGQPKGFVAFEIDTAKPRGQRVAIPPALVTVPARRFVTVEVRPRETDPTPEVCAAIERAEVADAIVRVQVHVTPEQSSLFRIPEARRLLESAHFVAGVRTVLPQDSRTSKLPPGVQPDATDPAETLDLYLKVNNYDDARRQRLLAAARDLMATPEAGVA